MSAASSTDAEFDARFARVEGLLDELSRQPDARLGQLTRDVLATVLELHQRGLERVLTIAAGDSQVQSELASDARVSAMLLLHGLHPVGLEQRVARAVETLSARFRSKVERASVESRAPAQIVVRLIPASHACSSTRANLKKEWEAALLAAAPDAETISLELAAPAPALVTLRLRKTAPPVLPSGAPR